MAWTILVEDHQRNISAILYCNRSSGFWQEDFLSFLYRYIGQISPHSPPPPPPPHTHTHTHTHPGDYFFWQIQMAWTILVEDHQRNISAKLYGNLSSGFWQEDFLSFLCSYIGKKSSVHWPPCFLTNPNSLNNLGRGSPKEHFCKIKLKSVQWFLTRRFLKFSL